jgi:PAS domain S-box-containing protein
MTREELLAHAERLERRLDEAESTIRALTLGELDSVDLGSAGNLVLLRAAQQHEVAQEAWYRKLFEASPLTTFVLDLETRRIVAANPAMAREYGYSQEELLGLALDDILHPSELARAQLVISRQPGSYEGNGGIWRHQRKDGGLLDVELVSHEIRFADRRAGLVIAANVTARLAAERRLRESEESIRTTLQSIGDAVISTDVRGRIVRMNPVAERLTDWKEAAAIGTPVKEVVQIRDERSDLPIDDIVGRVIAEGAVIAPTRRTVLVARDGTRRSIQKSAAPIRDASGHLSGVVMVLRDVSRERAAHDALRRSQRRLAEAQRVAQLASWEWDPATGRLEILDDVPHFGTDDRNRCPSVRACRGS